MFRFFTLVGNNNFIKTFKNQQNKKIKIYTLSIYVYVLIVTCIIILPYRLSPVVQMT